MAASPKIRLGLTLGAKGRSPLSVKNTALYNQLARMLIETSVAQKIKHPAYILLTFISNLAWRNFQAIENKWRRVPESNRCTRICNPLRNQSANSPEAHVA